MDVPNLCQTPTRWASVNPRPGGLESWTSDRPKRIFVSLMGKPWFSLRNPTPRCFFVPKFWGYFGKKNIAGWKVDRMSDSPVGFW